MGPSEAAAEQLLWMPLRQLRLNAASLAELPKGAPQKVVLAGRQRERTTTSLWWVAERLQMGYYPLMTQAVSRLKHRPHRGLRQLQNRFRRDSRKSWCHESMALFQDSLLHGSRQKSR